MESVMSQLAFASSIAQTWTGFSTRPEVPVGDARACKLHPVFRATLLVNGKHTNASPDLAPGPDGDGGSVLGARCVARVFLCVRYVAPDSGNRTDWRPAQYSRRWAIAEGQVEAESVNFGLTRLWQTECRPSESG
jgi:hypothetical protein